MRPTPAISPRLPRHLLIHTQNEDALRETYAEIYAEPRLTVKSKRDFDAAVSQCRLHDLRIAYGRYGTATSWEFPNAECFLYLVPIEGAGVLYTRKQECEAVRGKPVMVSPAAGHAAHYDASFAAIGLKFEEPLLHKRFEAIAGMALSAPLVFDAQSPRDAGASNMLQSYVFQLVDTIEQIGPASPEWWVDQTERLIMMLVLSGQRHNYSHLFDRSPAEVSMSQLTATESYIEANYDRPITIEELAEVSGVSVFALHQTFKKVRGYSPMQFVERIRREKTLLQ